MSDFSHMALIDMPNKGIKAGDIVSYLWEDSGYGESKFFLKREADRYHNIVVSQKEFSRYFEWIGRAYRFKLTKTVTKIKLFRKIYKKVDYSYYQDLINFSSTEIIYLYKYILRYLFLIEQIDRELLMVYSDNISSALDNIHKVQALGNQEMTLELIKYSEKVFSEILESANQLHNEVNKENSHYINELDKLQSNLLNECKNQVDLSTSLLKGFRDANSNLIGGRS